MLSWIVLVLSLLLSAFFSSSESALLSVSNARATSLKNKYITFLKENEELVVISILLGNNLVNVLASSIAAGISISYFQEYGIALATFVMTFIILTFGEIIPKSLAIYGKEKYLFPISKALYFWVLITKPLSSAYLMFIEYIKQIFGIKKSKEITEDEIEEILVLGEKQGEITKYEKKVAINALDLADTKVREIMVSKNKVELVPIDFTIGKLKDELDEKDINYSRLPVYYGSKNNIVGYIKINDLLGEKGNKKVFSVLRPILLISPDMNVEDLLKLMRKTGIPIAAIKNGGNFLGIVTMTDIIDEIVGSLREEVDIEELKERRGE